MFSLLLVLAVAGCTAGTKPAPAPPSAPTQAVEQTFSFNSPIEMETDRAGRVTIFFERALDPASARVRLNGPVNTEEVLPDRMVLHLIKEVQQGEVTLAAGTLDQNGARLAADWVIRLRRPQEAAITREAVPGGFQFGFPGNVATPVWKGPDRLVVNYYDGEAEIRLPGGEATARPPSDRRPVAGGKAELYTENGSFMWVRAGEKPRPVGNAYNVEFSPDDTRFVTYGKVGPGQWADLTTGETFRLDAPGYYGSSVFDSWAPDSSLYLVQALRDNKVPGFHFFGRDGRPAWSWHEPGYLSDWAVWSPDARQIAFLSTPLDLKYNMPPDAWDEPPMAPRLGILDLKTRTAKYYQLDGQLAAGLPVWSPDGKQVAMRFGPMREMDDSPYVIRGRIFVLDVATGALRPLTPEPVDDTYLQAQDWSPDSRALLIFSQGREYRSDGSASVTQQRHIAVNADGSNATLLPEQALWLDGNRLIVADGAGVLRLVDRQGKELQHLGQGYPPVISPDGTHVAFSSLTYVTVVRLNK